MGRKKRLIAGGLLTAAALVCAGIGVSRYLEEAWAGRNYEALRDQVKKEIPQPTEAPENGGTGESKTASESSGKPVEIPIDFETLTRENPDVYAWIQIPGTQVDYPILQSSEDDSYYLTHTIDGEEKTEGAIYTEQLNNKDFTDPNTVIYGHNMRNESMFGSLHWYEDREFFDENRELTIYLPDKILHYRIFAAYVYDNRHILQSFDFTNKTEYQGYLDSIFALKSVSNNIDTSAEVGSDDRIVTLSTCNAGRDEERYLVQAVLISIES